MAAAQRPSPDEPRRALVLAGGGIRVAWQAGAVQALDEAGLAFHHGDGTSGGIFNLGMLLSGVEPARMGERWRTLPVRRFVAARRPRDYLRPPTAWPSVGSADGVVEHVLPHLGVDPARIRRATHMTGTFNVADFTAKRCVAIPHDEMDLGRLVAGVSLPVLMPAVEVDGRAWTDAVWIRDANLWEAVRRGCEELWVLWCIGNTPRWGEGPLEQYVHMIELSATAALLDDLERVAELNRRRRAGEAVLGSSDPVRVHVVTPQVALPLDPDLLLGRIDAETLVAMGYRDASAYLASAAPGGVALDADPTAKPVPPLGVRWSLRAAGLFVAVEAVDVAAFAGDPGRGASAVGAVVLPGHGYRPFARATVVVERGSGGRRFRLDADLAVGGEPWALTASLDVADRGPRRWRREGALWWEAGPAGGPTAAASTETLGLRQLAAAAWSLEPTGAHGVADRARAAGRAGRLVLGR